MERQPTTEIQEVKAQPMARRRKHKRGQGSPAPTPTPAPAAAPPAEPSAPVSRSDSALFRRAIRERWPIDPEKRPAMVTDLMNTALNDSFSLRARLSAARAVLAADAQNMEQERRDEGIPDIVEQRVTILLPENFRDREAKP